MTALTAQQLFHKCAEIIADVPETAEAYPARMSGLSDKYPVAGRGFLPVATGSFHIGSIRKAIGSRKMLFVGQDWGTSDDLRALDCNPDFDVESSTGAILLKMLASNEVGIPSEDCFFTNALFGVRGEGRNTGISPGWKDSACVRRCANALRFQIDELKQKAIICLGRHAARLFAILYAQCEVLRTARGFEQIDGAGQSRLAWDPTAGPTLATIFLRPSFRAANAWRREYKKVVGLDADALILREVWAHANQ